MNCKTFIKALPGYLYGESSIGEKEAILAHARSCYECRRVLDDMAGTVSLLREEEKARFSRGEMAALRMRVKRDIAGMDLTPARSPIRPRLRFFSRPILLPATGALIAASIIAVLIFHPAGTTKYIVPETSGPAEELLTMTEIVEEEYNSIDELCREMDELQQLFLNEPNSGQEAEIGLDCISAPV
ncbi:MAG: zf-HC2 domain-containing protein [Candidatus Auribacterota bacterium]|nr:zf-HC2 domain-containing protein [Candidatus Auribacterota bacterium]